MKMKSTSILLAALIGAIAVNCGSAETKKEPVVEKTPEVKKDQGALNLQSSGPDVIVDEANKKLSDRLITGYEKNQVDVNTMPGWLKSALPIVKEIAATVPAGYVLLVEGHTDQSGTDAINQTISEGRARVVFNLLVSNGIAKDKLRYQGSGTKYLLNSADPYDGKNRRVTFKIVKK